MLMQTSAWSCVAFVFQRRCLSLSFVQWLWSDRWNKFGGVWDPKHGVGGEGEARQKSEKGATAQKECTSRWELCFSGMCYVGFSNHQGSQRESQVIALFDIFLT